MEFFNAGLDQLDDWTTADYEWVLLTAGTFDADIPTVADVITAGAEVTVTGYTRLAAATKVRSVDDALDQVTYTAADPDFGTLDVGEDVTAVMLTRVVTDDTDSIPVGWWEVSPPAATDSADPFVFTLVDGIVAYSDQAV